VALAGRRPGVGSSLMAHPDNAFYGHDAVLAEAAGLPPGERRRPIWGQVQHGWQLGTGLNAGPRLVPWLPKLVWSSTNRALADAEGVGHVRSIGAPFLYLDRLRRPASRPSGPSTIVYPLHGWEQEAADGPHERLAQAVTERETGSVTVCLYWVEHDQPDVRAAYERAGFRVITHGRRDDPSFLERQWRELGSHSRIVSNRVSTALWYGMWLGLEAEVYGPRFVVRSTAEADRRDAVYRRRWPELVDGVVPGERGRQMAGEELGADGVLAPDELAAALGWEGGGRSSRVALAATRAEHKRRALVARRRERDGTAWDDETLARLEADPWLGRSLSR